jgi:hypothetical protein
VDRGEQERAGPPGAPWHIAQRLDKGRLVAHRLHGPCRQVAHDIPDEVHTIGQSLGGEVPDRGLRGHEGPTSQVVGHDAVHLLGHAPVERAQARLDMGDGSPKSSGDQRGGQRGIRVAEDEHGVGTDLRQRPLEADHDPPGLLGRGPTATVQGQIRSHQTEIAEEHARHRIVPVLSRVDERLVVARAKLGLEGGGLDELWSRPDDGGDSHGPVVLSRRARVATPR